MTISKNFFRNLKKIKKQEMGVLDESFSEIIPDENAEGYTYIFHRGDMFQFLGNKIIQAINNTGDSDKNITRIIPSNPCNFEVRTKHDSQEGAVWAYLRIEGLSIKHLICSRFLYALKVIHTKNNDDEIISELKKHPDEMSLYFKYFPEQNFISTETASPGMDTKGYQENEYGYIFEENHMLKIDPSYFIKVIKDRFGNHTLSYESWRRCKTYRKDRNFALGVSYFKTEREAVMHYLTRSNKHYSYLIEQKSYYALNLVHNENNNSEISKLLENNPNFTEAYFGNFPDKKNLNGILKNKEDNETKQYVFADGNLLTFCGDKLVKVINNIGCKEDTYFYHNHKGLVRVNVGDTYEYYGKKYDSECDAVFNYIRIENLSFQTIISKKYLYALKLMHFESNNREIIEALKQFPDNMALYFMYFPEKIFISPSTGENKQDKPKNIPENKPKDQEIYHFKKWLSQKIEYTERGKERPIFVKNIMVLYEIEHPEIITDDKVFNYLSKMCFGADNLGNNFKFK